jgi:hypothetical protein
LIAAITVLMRPSTVPSPIPMMPASVCILTKMVRSEWTGMISSRVILMASRGLTMARALLSGWALTGARSAASNPAMPRPIVIIQWRREWVMARPSRIYVLKPRSH